MTTGFSDNIGRIQNGDREALDELIQRWRPILRLYAHGLLGRQFSARADSSDVVQDTMIQASRCVNQFQGETEAQWGAWLRRILQNEAARYRRQHLESRRTVVRESGQAEEEAKVDPPLEKTIEIENVVLVAAAIEKLPQPMRDGVVRRTFQHHSFNEIAESTGRTPGVVRVIWARALRKLHASLAVPDESGD